VLRLKRAQILLASDFGQAEQAVADSRLSLLQNARGAPIGDPKKDAQVGDAIPMR